MLRHRDANIDLEQVAVPALHRRCDDRHVTAGDPLNSGKFNVYPRAAHCCTKATYARTARNRCWRPGSHIPPFSAAIATTHWIQAANFKARFPDVRMEEDRIYINDGPIWTSAGMTAGIDLVLAMIDRDLGPEVAKVAAKLMVIDQRRMGGQTQHSALLDMTPKSDRIELVVAYIRQNLRSPLSVEELAAVANLGPRQFSRAFLAETGQSPARAVERLRLEAARFMIEEGRHSVKVVAQETGFADRERMRRAFLRTFGVPAEALRRNARQAAMAAD
jgi:transcriptional regulator GlxA family with amidase domain